MTVKQRKYANNYHNWSSNCIENILSLCNLRRIINITTTTVVQYAYYIVFRWERIGK